MYKYIDIYKRSINVGDFVLCDVDLSHNDKTYTHIENTSLFQVCPDGILRDSNGDAPDCEFYLKTQDCFSHNMLEIHTLNNNVEKLKVYKIEILDNYLLSLWSNKRYNMHECIKNVASNTIDLGSDFLSNHKEIIELFGRELNSGDFVMYKFAKTKASYGLIFSNREVFNEVGGKETPEAVYKIINPTKEEKEIYNSLLNKYNSISKLSNLKLNKEEPKQFGFYLNKPKKKMYLYLENAMANVLEKRTNQVVSRPLKQPLVIEFDLKQTKSGKLFEKILNLENITESDIKSAYVSSVVSPVLLNGNLDLKFFIDNFGLLTMTKRTIPLSDLPKSSFSYYLCQAQMEKFILNDTENYILYLTF